MAVDYVFQNAILGSPLSHSMSPKIHTLAYRLLDLPFQYTAKELTAGEFPNFLLAARRENYRGFSITMPLKFLAATFADNLSDYAARGGVANTLVFESPGDSSQPVLGGNTSDFKVHQLGYKSDTGQLPHRVLVGHNTDVLGIMKTISYYDLDCSRIAILGCGGTAISTLIALDKIAAGSAERTISNVAVYVRNVTKARKTLGLLGFDADVLPFTDFSGGFSLTINTLPCNIVPTLAKDRFSTEASTGALFDVNYSPWPTPLSRLWPADRTVSGLLMLVEQAIAQIALFHLTELPLDAEEFLRDNLYREIGVH